MARDFESVGALYDRWAGHRWTYELMTRAAFFGRRERLRRAAVSSLRLRPGDTVLDLACGPGADLELLGSAVGPTGRIVAIDASAEMLERARQRGEELGLECSLELRRADLAEAELGAACADGALIALALSALPDRLAALRRIRAALRPGASLAVVDTLPFTGAARPLNRLAGPPFRAVTNWDYEADLVADLRATFGSVEARRYNAGSALLATAH